MGVSEAQRPDKAASMSFGRAQGEQHRATGETKPCDTQVQRRTVEEMLRVALLAGLALAALATGTGPDGPNNNFPNPDVVATDATPGPVHPSVKPTPTPDVPESEPTQSHNFAPMRRLSKASCGEEFNVTSEGPLRGYFHSPNFPLAYPANLSCLWKIRGPEGFRLKLELRSVDTELNEDLLSVHAGCAPHPHSRVFSLSGRDSGRSVLFGSNSASIVFSSDAFVSGQGFLATFRFVPVSDDALHIAGHSATLLSPAFPAAFQPAASLRPARPAPTQGSSSEPVDEEASAPLLDLFSASLARHSFVLNVTKGNGMYLSLPETELPEGASVALVDVAEDCDLDSPRSLSLSGNSSLSETLYSQCSSVRVTFLLPAGRDAKYRLEVAEVCQQWSCYGDYYLGRWAALSFNLMFFAALLSLLAACCCCCDRLCRSGETERPRRRHRRSCRPAFANPTYKDDAPALPTKAPVSDA